MMLLLVIIVMTTMTMVTIVSHDGEKRVHYLES